MLFSIKIRAYTNIVRSIYLSVFICILITPNTRANEQIEPFHEFFERSLDLTHSKLAKIESTRVRDKSTFSVMMKHFRQIYTGTKVPHSYRSQNKVFDCIPINHQPSMKMSGMENHILQRVPPKRPAPPEPNNAIYLKEMEQQHKNAMALRPKVDPFGNTTTCPKEHVSIPRTTLEEMARFVDLNEYFSKGATPLSAHAAQSDSSTKLRYAAMFQTVGNDGIRATISIWNPNLAPGNVSIAQLWIVGGHHGDGTLQTIESGWYKYTDFEDGKFPVSFFGFTPDNYKTFYFNDYSVFNVVENTPYKPGYSYKGRISTAQNGNISEQIESDTFAWFRDANNGNWWLFINNYGVGYIAKEQFNNGELSKSASRFELGGEVHGKPNSGEMGNGLFASQGADRAATIYAIYYYVGVDLETAKFDGLNQTNESCYQALTQDGKNRSQYYIVYGGPSCADN